MHYVIDDYWINQEIQVKNIKNLLSDNEPFQSHYLDFERASKKMTMKRAQPKIVLCLDASFSMERMPYEAVLRLEALLNKLAVQHGDVTMEMFYFGDEVDKSSLVQCTLKNHAEYIDYSKAWPSYMYKTHLYDAIDFAINRSHDQPTLILVVTDGCDDTSAITKEMLKNAVATFKSKGNQMIVIGPCDDKFVFDLADVPMPLSPVSIADNISIALSSRPLQRQLSERLYTLSK